jgi:hypothetical protein
MTLNNEQPRNYYQPAFTQAEYKEQFDSEGNPLIDALPLPLSERELYQKLTIKPVYPLEQLKKTPGHLRVQMLNKLKRFFQPLPRHCSLAQDITKFIRSGYETRNPMSPGYRHELSMRNAELERATDPEHVTKCDVDSLRSGLLVGMSGTGKTFSVQQILALTPQVIEHTNYKGAPFPHKQLSWIKIGCPSDRGTRALCSAFFKAVDDLLGTNYTRNYMKDHVSPSSLLPKWGIVALNHSLGLLVIDEVQNLNLKRSGGSLQLLNYIVEIVNALGVPILMVGNSNALDLLTSTMRSARRSTGLLNPYWMKFRENDSDWGIFLEELWDCQYLKQKTELTPELRREFYNQTQGIADYAVQLYEGIQQQLINEADGEIITPELVTRMAQQKLAPNLALIEAIRKSDYASLQVIGDVHPVDILGPSAEAMKGWPKRSVAVMKQLAEKLDNQSEMQLKLPDYQKPKPAPVEPDMVGDAVKHDIGQKPKIGRGKKSKSEGSSVNQG